MLVERNQQLGSMEEAAQRAASGQGSVVLVSGEAGIGKTSLVTEFVGSLDGAAVLWGACEDLGTARTFGPLHDMARGHPALVEALRTGSHVDVNEALRGVVSPPIGLAIGVIEDAHWADQATIDAVRYVGRRIARGRGLLVITARAEALVGDHPLRRALGGIPPGSVIRIDLPPLTRDGVVALAGPEPADEVLAITGGNPFFVTELLDSGLELPRSVVDSVLARAAGLTGPTRDVLALVAVVPGETDRPMVLAAHADADEAIAEAEAAGLIVSTPARIRFRHELARRAYESALSGDRRRTANRTVLSWLESHGADPARLVHHAEQAGDLDRVVTWAPVAARGAASAGAHRQAVEHLLRVAGMVDRYPADEAAELLELLAWELYVVGRVSEAVGHAERAIEIRTELGDPASLGRALRVLSRVRWMSGNRRGSEGDAERAIAVLEPLGESVDLAFAYSARSQLAMLAGEDEEAIRWGTVAVDMARRIGADQVLSHALTNVGTATAHAGRMDEGLALVDEALAIALSGGYDEDAARAWTNIIWQQLWTHRYAEMASRLETAIAFVQDAQQDGFVTYLVATRAMHRVETGDFAGAESDARWALDQPAGEATSGFPSRSALGTVLGRRGEFDAARAVLEQGWRQALDNTELQRTFPMAVAIAELAWLEGRPVAGLHALAAIEGQLTRLGTPWDRSEAAFWRARAGIHVEPPPDTPEPYRLWFAGDHRGAARAWVELGARYRAADFLGDSGVAADVEEARARMEQIGATVVADRLSQRLVELRAQVRTVTTVLFTDIVGSTELAGRLGDHEWRRLLDRHDALTAEVVGRHGGRVVDGTGDGVMAAFASPSAAIDAAMDLVDRLAALGTAIRAGLHTGETVSRGDDIGGIAVHVAARVGAEAVAGQVLVSSTTRDLVAGGRWAFADLGTRRLKGLDEEWKLFAVAR